MRHRFQHLPDAILLAPVLAATPMLVLALGAFAAQSVYYRSFVDAAFGFLLIAWPATAMVGLPVHLILARLRFAGLAHAIAGAAIGALLAWLSVDASGSPPWGDAGGGSSGTPPAAHLWQLRESWTWMSWIGVTLQGALTGWCFFRRVYRGVHRFVGRRFN